MEKYMIFNKNMSFAPLSLLDANKNSKVMELSLEMAKKYVEKLNQDENSIDVILPCTTAPSRVKEFIFKSSPQKVIS